MADDASKAAGDGVSPAGENDLARFKRYFTESEQLTQEARKNSLTALDYYDSDQFTREELNELNNRKQPAIVINRIKPAINGIIGVTEKGRSDPRAWPRNPGDDDTADAATDVLRYIADFNRFKRLKQDCFTPGARPPVRPTWAHRSGRSARRKEPLRRARRRS